MTGWVRASCMVDELVSREKQQQATALKRAADAGDTTIGHMAALTAGVRELRAVVLTAPGPVRWMFLLAARIAIALGIAWPLDGETS